MIISVSDIYNGGTEMRLSGSGYNLGYSHIASNQSGKVGLPVARSAVIYSHYEHVQGYSARENSPTVPISKIRILNNLIDNLSKMKSEPSPSQQFDSSQEMSSEAIGNLIDSYAKELHRVVTAAQTGFNAVETGLVVSLSA